MRIFAYAPDVRAYVATEDHGVLDLSADIISGSVNRVENQVSSASLTLQNNRMKYLRKIKPMDRIVIHAQRIHQPTQIFSGYIDEAPHTRIYPGPVTITASCTLKRLLHTYFDPGLPFVSAFINQFGWIYDAPSGNLQDQGLSLYDFDNHGGLGEFLYVVLNAIGGWPKNNIHVLPLPKNFITMARNAIIAEHEEIQERRDEVERWLKKLMTVDGSGTFGANYGGNFVFGSTFADNRPLPNTLARQYDATIYGASFSGNLSETGQINDVTMAKHIIQAGWNTPEEAWVALAVAMAESSLDANVANGFSGCGTWSDGVVGCRGIFQISAAHEGTIYGDAPRTVKVTAQTVVNARHNATMARGIWADAKRKGSPTGWSGIPGNPGNPWEAHYNGRYLRYEARAKAAVAKAFAGENSTPNTQTDPSLQGEVGDVTVGSQQFFSGGARSFMVRQLVRDDGYTFRIKPNPYQNDNMVFRARRYDPSLGEGKISIYVPGAKDRLTPQAQAWVDQKVTLETSIDLDSRFDIAPPTGINPGSPIAAPENIDSWVGLASNANTPTRCTKQDQSGNPYKVSQATINFVARIASIYGSKLIITSGVNHENNCGSSDHDWGEGADIGEARFDGSSSNVNPQLTRLGQAALIAAGMSEAEARTKTGGLYNLNGYQIIFNVDGSGIGDHYNHLHVGLGARTGSRRRGGTGEDKTAPPPIPATGQQAALTLPADFGDKQTHETDGLPGFPALDIFGSVDTTVGAPEDGIILRLSGRCHSLGSSGEGGALGYSIYMRGSSGTTYFMTHFATVTVAPGQAVRRGEMIGTIAYHPRGAHIHIGKSSSISAVGSGDDRILCSGDVRQDGTGGGGYAGGGDFSRNNPTGVSVRDIEQIALSVGIGLQIAFPTAGTQSQFYKGERALANDIPLFEWVEQICTASGRKFQSAPNGDFIAYYPDYFGWSDFKKEFSPYFRISDMELIDFEIDISDKELTTHLFATGDTFINNDIDFQDKFSSTVASVESPSFKNFVNVSEDYDPYPFLRRYGARPLNVEERMIKHPVVQFMYGWTEFLRKWANQFKANVSITFMPELYPGTTVEFMGHNLVMYVESVTHSFDRASGFTTTAVMSAPSTYPKDRGVNYAMVLNKGGLAQKERGPTPVEQHRDPTGPGATTPRTDTPGPGGGVPE